MITIETRIAVEVKRHVLTAPDITKIDQLDGDGKEDSDVICRKRFNTVPAAALIALLQPWTERPAREGDVVTKVAGARYRLLIGIVDEPGVRCLVNGGSGGPTPWRECDAEGSPWLVIVGTEAELAMLRAPRTVEEIAARIRRSIAMDERTDWMLRSVFGIKLDELVKWIVVEVLNKNFQAGFALVRRDTRSAHRCALEEPRGCISPMGG